ncbi:MAG: hypothetical protein KC479_03280, partial [Dehalococcoidia bacterium]|nr:hypothetical protein [Dehalococcoidia bacterium]
MAFWGGAGAGGWSTGIGGQQGGPRGGRGSDGWDEDYLGKAYDAEVARRLIPYIVQYRFAAILAFVAMMMFAIAQFVTPLFIGLTVKAGAEGNEDRVFVYLGVLIGLALMGMTGAFMQQLTTAWIGNKLLLQLRTEMYDHIQGLSLSFFDDMEVGRIISRLTSDVTVMQELLTTGSLTFLADFVGLFTVVVILLILDWELALVTFAVVPPLIFVMV